MGGKESGEEREIESLATADIPDVCTGLASVRTDRRKTGLSSEAGTPVPKQHCAAEWRANPSHFKCSRVPAYPRDRGMNDMSLMLLSWTSEFAARLCMLRRKLKRVQRSIKVNSINLSAHSGTFLNITGIRY
jgi:hypothetical protein